MDKEKFDRLKAISNNAAKQASLECASKIARLTDSGIDDLLEDLKHNCVDKAEVDKLFREMQVSTDKNKTMSNFIEKSGNVCRAVLERVGKYL